MAYLQHFLHPLLVKQQDSLSCEVDWCDIFKSATVGIFTLITSVRVQLLTEWASASLIHRLRLFERQEGGHPVYRDHREDRDWLRGDSLIKYASAIGRRGERGGGCRVLFRRNRVGRGGGYSEQSGICRQCPMSQKFRFSLVDLSTAVNGFQ